jgi:hypothetical protein
MGEPVGLVWLFCLESPLMPPTGAVAKVHLRNAGRVQRSQKSIKNAPRFACLDEYQICQTKGARSRNHKKMGRPARRLEWIVPSSASALGTSSGPKANIGAVFRFL